MTNQVLKNIIYKDKTINKYLKESFITDIKDRIKKIFIKKNKAQEIVKQLPVIQEIKKEVEKVPQKPVENKKVVIGIKPTVELKKALEVKNEPITKEEKLSKINELIEQQKKVNDLFITSEMKELEKKLIDIDYKLSKQEKVETRDSDKAIIATKEEMEKIINRMNELTNEDYNKMDSLFYELKKMLSVEERDILIHPKDLAFKHASSQIEKTKEEKLPINVLKNKISEYPDSEKKEDIF